VEGAQRAAVVELRHLLDAREFGVQPCRQASRRQTSLKKLGLPYQGMPVTIA
jgi:hypothetical protein